MMHRNMKIIKHTYIFLNDHFHSEYHLCKSTPGKLTFPKSWQDIDLSVREKLTSVVKMHLEFKAFLHHMSRLYPGHFTKLEQIKVPSQKNKSPSLRETKITKSLKKISARVK